MTRTIVACSLTFACIGSTLALSTVAVASVPAAAVHSYSVVYALGAGNEGPALAAPDAESPAVHAGETSSEPAPQAAVPVVPFYSQFTDISDPAWRKIGCGIASLAMLIDYYAPAVPADTLLADGIARGAYLSGAGWTHAGLIAVAQEYGLTGATVGLSHLSSDDARGALADALAEGPVMASVHYTFDPQNPIPHLVVVTGIDETYVHYNDPAEEIGGGTVSIEQFMRAWKKRYIAIRPVVVRE